MKIKETTKEIPLAQEDMDSLTDDSSDIPEPLDLDLLDCSLANQQNPDFHKQASIRTS